MSEFRIHTPLAQLAPNRDATPRETGGPCCMSGPYGPCPRPAPDGADLCRFHAELLR